MMMLPPTRIDGDRTRDPDLGDDGQGPDLDDGTEDLSGSVSNASLLHVFLFLQALGRVTLGELLLFLLLFFYVLLLFCYVSSLKTFH